MFVHVILYNFFAFFERKIMRPMLNLRFFIGAVVLLFLSLVTVEVAAHSPKQKEIAVLNFEQNPIDKMDENYIRVNGERLIPPYDSKQHDYYAISMNTLRPIEISVGSQTQAVKLKRLSFNTYISIHVGQSVYKIFTAMPGLPSYKFKRTGNYHGDLYITPSSMSLEVPAYAYIIDETGGLAYYRANETPPWTMANLNKNVLKNGKVRYSVFRQFNNITPQSFFFGEEIIMDENFKVIDRLQLSPYSDRPTYPVENHSFVMMDDGHYIITGYYYTVDYQAPWKNKKIVVPVIQEVKNGQLIFEWRANDYPELFKTCMEGCNHQDDYQDYLHLNSVTVDPNDGNLIVSMAHSSQIIKINRLNGKIMWKLGGISDDFNLTDEQFFLRQHDVRMTKDGWLVLFDNYYPNPGMKERLAERKMGHDFYHSRLLALKLDEENKKVADFKEFDLGQSVHFMGSYQPLPNGRFLIGYGSNQDIAAKELDESHIEYMSLSFNKPYTSYKAYKYER